MRYCIQCGNSMDYVPLADASPVCTDCGEAHDGSEDRIHSPEAQRWIDVARVSNLAEAGFLADDLAGLGLPARIYQADEFSGLGGSWNTAYLLQVPAACARAAAARIREHLAEDAGRRERTLPDQSFVDEDRSIDPTLWRPVALIALVSAASFVLGQRMSEQRPEPRPPRDSLSSAISAIGRPLVTEPAPGQPRYRLSYDWHSEVWNLDADTDGDGRFDRRRRFRDSDVDR